MPLYVLHGQAATVAKLRFHKRAFVANHAKQADTGRVGKRKEKFRERGAWCLDAVHVAAAAPFFAEERDKRGDKPSKPWIVGIATRPKQDEVSVADGLDQSALLLQNTEMLTRRGGIQPRHVGVMGGGQTVWLGGQHGLAQKVQPLMVRQPPTEVAEVRHPLITP